MKKIIEEGGCIPKGYGVAWRVCNSSLNIICYPLPINLVVRLYKHCLWGLMSGLFRSKYEGELIRATAEGYRRARGERVTEEQINE